MIVKIDLPEISEYAQGFPQFWATTFFAGTVSDNYAVNALAASFVRLVEAALTEYRLAHVRLNEFWNTHTSFNLRAIHQAISHFESCVTNMHRAIRCVIRLRASPDSSEAVRNALGPDKPQFVADRISRLFTNIRDAVHHADEQLLNGTIPPESPFALKPDGPVTEIPEQPGQTLKTIDRLVIGNVELKFADLHRWLLELSRYAQLLSEYER
jgi:hypothetical protein